MLDAEGNLAVDAGAADAAVDVPLVDVNRPEVACFPPNKLCEGNCVQFDDPDYGCAPGTCEPCPHRAHGVMGCSTNECVIVDCEGSQWNCNGDPFDGCETDLWTVDDCGACGTPCATPHADAVCEQGTCGVGPCHPGWGDCDGVDGNGCETDLRTLENCAQCGKPCETTGGEPTCVTGQCAVDTCDAGRADCNGDAADGCETDLGSLGNCGACNRLCSPPNAAGACVGGACIIQACYPSYGDCNSDPVDGCETNIHANADNCGACGAPCSGVHTMARACDGGFCVPTCESGWGDCNAPLAGSADDGCERDLYSSTDCGGCDDPCVFPHASGLCPYGQCSMGACDPGWADCDHWVQSGCERDVASDVTSCGGCDVVCPIRPRAGASCQSGACDYACFAGWGDCDANAFNGCETDTTVDDDHCGACGAACVDPQHATASCEAAVCGFSCSAGWDDCNGMESDGCEADLASIGHCGACGNACPERPHATRTCEAGTCGFVCLAGWEDCNGSPADGCEADLGSTSSCGACGVVCPSAPHAAASCSASGCGFVCEAGFGDCNAVAADGCEANLAFPGDCGGCGNVCPGGPNATPECVGGMCEISCSPGWADCNLVSADGCEADLTQPQYCGVCGNLCPTPGHASATCTAGSCGFDCNTGWDDCDGAAPNGCETDLSTDPAHCGACTNICAAPPHRAAVCASGGCSFTCAAGWGDCNAVAADGCETDVLSDPDHCGDCVTGCGYSPAHAVPACAAGSCTYACLSGWGDCDANAVNGCEADLADPDHCGTCTLVCPSGGAGTERGCEAGQCTLHCVAGMEDCNADLSDGCECAVGCCSDGGSCGC